MTERILYVESKGAGMDNEHTKANGIWVRLSYWEPEHPGFPNLPPHYVIEHKVMIGREYVNEIASMHVEHWNKDAEYIRAVINIMDVLCIQYPQVTGETTVEE